MALGLYLEDDYIVFKTLNENEYKMLKYYTNTKDNPRVLLYKLALSTFMINGNNTLNDRINNIPELYDMYKKIPYRILSRLNEELDKLYTEYLESLDYFEGFCYTDRSKYLWRVLNNNNPVDSDYFGICGTKILGLNSIQENWIIINQKLDDESEYEQQFHLSVLVASSFNPKGARSISRDFEVKKQELDDTRSVIAEYGYDKKRQEEERKQAKWTAPLRTREDLVRELNRQMQGEKDNHDLFMIKWIEQQKKIADETKKKVEEKQEEYKKEVSKLDLTNYEDSRVLNPEEMRNLSNKLKKEGNTLLRDVKKVRDNALNDKYIKRLSSTIIKAEK